MNWSILTTSEELAALLKKSFINPQLIFKHSTRCSISRVIKTRLEKSAIPPFIDFYYLDLLAYSSLSNTISQQLDVYHASPQVLYRYGICNSPIKIELNSYSIGIVQ